MSKRAIDQLKSRVPGNVLSQFDQVKAALEPEEGDPQLLEELSTLGALEGLIEGTSIIIRDAGWELPERKKQLVETTLLLGKFDIKSPEGFAKIALHIIDRRNDAKLTVYDAYFLFLGARLDRKKDPARAIRSLSLGALALARGVSLLGQLDRVKGGAAKSSTDSKQIAKAGALELWKERRAGKHRKLRTNEQFAMEVMRRWPVLASSKVICGWCTVWSKEAMV